LYEGIAITGRGLSAILDENQIFFI